MSQHYDVEQVSNNLKNALKEAENQTGHYVSWFQNNKHLTYRDLQNNPFHNSETKDDAYGKLFNLIVNSHPEYDLFDVCREGYLFLSYTLTPNSVKNGCREYYNPLSSSLMREFEPLWERRVS